MVILRIPNNTRNEFGGGSTFLLNFFNHTANQVLYEDTAYYDKLFVANPMRAERYDFTQAKESGKQIIIRLDNIPEDFNNRGTAISRLKDFIKLSDKVVFQSKWAKQKYYLMFPEVQGKKHKIIYNGVDTELYKPNKDGYKGITYLYVKSSRNENKRYPEVLEMYRIIYAKDPTSRLILVGQFAEDLRNYNFGFYNGERILFLGAEQSITFMINAYAMSDILLFPAYADCSPNVVVEAMACGVVPVIHPYGGGIEYTGHKLGININKVNDYASIAWRASKIKPEVLHEHIKNNFDVKKMAKEYDDFINE